MIVRRSALLAMPAAHLFDVIEAAEHYPAFLPWCAGAKILLRDDELVSADLQMRMAGMNFEMRTRNPKRRPEYMAIHLERGPFKRFEGEWQLKVLAPEACKVAFLLDYDFDSAFMTRAAGPVFNRIADSMVDAFVQRAMALPFAAEAVAAPVPVPVPEPTPVTEPVPMPPLDAPPIVVQPWPAPADAPIAPAQDEGAPPAPADAGKAAAEPGVNPQASQA